MLLFIPFQTIHLELPLLPEVRLLEFHLGEDGKLFEQSSFRNSLGLDRPKPCPSPPTRQEPFGLLVNLTGAFIPIVPSHQSCFSCVLTRCFKESSSILCLPASQNIPPSFVLYLVLFSNLGPYVILLVSVNFLTSSWLTHCLSPNPALTATWQANALPLFSLSFFVWKNTASLCRHLVTLWQVPQEPRHSGWVLILALQILSILLGQWFPKCGPWISSFISSFHLDLLEMQIVWPYPSSTEWEMG